LRDYRREDASEQATVRALEIAKDYDGDAGIGWPYGGIPFYMELRETVGEGVGGHVKHIAAEEGFAVFADEDCAFIGLSVCGDFDRDCVEGI
jgi:hypothetical protein